MELPTNLLTLTDEQISEHLELILIRHIARNVAKNGVLTTGIIYNPYGVVESFEEKSFAEHLYHDNDISVKHCEIVEVSDITEKLPETNNEEIYDDNELNEFSLDSPILVSINAEVGCVHGYRANATCVVDLAQAAPFPHPVF